MQTDPFLIEVQKIKDDIKSKDRSTSFKDVTVTCPLCIATKFKERFTCKIYRVPAHVKTMTHKKKLKEYLENKK